MAFNPPPIDLALEYALDFHLEQNPDHVAITYPSANGKDFKLYTYRDLVPAIHRAGHAVLEGFPESSRRTSPVVVIIIKTDSITYLAVVVVISLLSEGQGKDTDSMFKGLLRAGLTPFPISSRFPTSVITHLVNESRPGAILVDESTRDFVKQAVGDSALQPSLCTLPSYRSLFPGHNEFTPIPKHERRPEDICALMHSSSSTAVYPKLIPWTSVALTHHGEIKDVPPQQLAGRVLGCFGMEMFHSYGMCVFFTMVRRGLVVAMMDPLDPASILPVEMTDVYRCFQIFKPEMLLANPRAIEIWAEDPEKVALFRDSGVTIYYGGRFLNKNVGDRLVRSGVKICTVYGGTEAGPMLIFPHFQGDDWEYFSVHPRPDVNFVSRGGDDLFELFVAPTEEPNYLALANAVWNGRPAYNPGDLFLAHPLKPHTYKMFGRLNDQIMLTTGQAINPITIEEEMSSHPLIKSAVMFGHTRSKVGLVIEAPDSFYIRNEQGSYLKDIWPVIESVNMKSPPHARVSREMIIVASLTKPISMGPKGYPRRPIVWLHYQDEIDTLYSSDQKAARG